VIKLRCWKLKSIKKILSTEGHAAHIKTNVTWYDWFTKVLFYSVHRLKVRCIRAHISTMHRWNQPMNKTTQPYPAYRQRHTKRETERKADKHQGSHNSALVNVTRVWNRTHQSRLDISNAVVLYSEILPTQQNRGRFNTYTSSIELFPSVAETY